MKKALVLSLLVLGLGLGVSAQTFSGDWTFDAAAHINAGNIVVTGLATTLDINYSVAGWTFGSGMWVDLGGLNHIQFTVDGSLGAFGLHSMALFGANVPAWYDFENIVSVSIAGIDVYGVFVVSDLAYPQTPSTVGTGWAIGGHGVAGSVEVWAELDFNLQLWGGSWNGPRVYYNYGFDTLYAWDVYQNCDGSLTYDGWVVQTTSCAVAFSALNIYVEFPLGCLDFVTNVQFTCAGFGSITFGLNDVNLGAGWFQLDDLDVKFTAISKTVTTDFTLTFGDAVCLTPKFDLVQDGLFTIDGIELRALLFEYAFGATTIKAGELFTTGVLTSGTGYPAYYGFTLDGNLETTDEDCIVDDADEFIGVWYEGLACCDGPINASFVVFFDGNLLAASTSTGLFDFILLTANVEVGIGENFLTRLGMSVSDGDLESIQLGFTFSW
jgi:hypothetical protein